MRKNAGCATALADVAANADTRAQIMRRRSVATKQTRVEKAVGKRKTHDENA